MEKIIESGYSDLFFYFLGKSKFGNNYGWAGHTSNGSQYSTPASIFRDAVVDIKEVLNYINRGGTQKSPLRSILLYEVYFWL